MNPHATILRSRSRLVNSLCFTFCLLLVPGVAQARKPIRDAFFTVYPSAQNTILDNQVASSSKTEHCGVCHFDFSSGGNPWNPYGLTVRSNITAGMSFENAILAAGPTDPDGDGYDSTTEILDTTNYVNTPTFPGLTPANINQVVGVGNLSDIQGYLVPSGGGGDTEPPDVTILQPNGGELLTANVLTNIIWTSHDDNGVAGVNLYLSLDNGVTYDPIAFGVPSPNETNSYAWFPPNRPSSNALIRIVAVDNFSNTTNVESAAVFTIMSPPGGVVPTTLRDFDMPGTQPHELTAGISSPANCVTCHGNYNTNHEPYFNWGGSMMAHASIDPLFEANLAIANQDAPDSGDLCLRCHIHSGWVEGRSVPTSGEAMLASDKFGVSCALCHRMLDPVHDPGVSPIEDASILAGMVNPGTNFGNGMVHLDPTATRRGPFLDATNAHAILVSPFHREAALCGTCHDVSNPAFDRNPDGSYSPNALDAPATDFSPHKLGPVERTYSEWLASDFNSASGVYLPEFAGNKTNGMVSTCQDCHMRAVVGYGCNTNLYPGVPLRPDLPLHDMTGGSTWLPTVLADLYPGMVNSNAVAAGVARAAYMLQNATDLAVGDAGTQIQVIVTNNCGHKLPTGYPEGRRIWLNVQFYDANTNLLSESGAYTNNTGELAKDPELKIYEVHPGIDSNLVSILESLGQTGYMEGPSFHFVLNNKIYEDNRIPPRGFTNAVFETFGGAPAGYTYADGQYWDDTFYNIPEGATRAEVRLYYQSTSKEFVEFLRDENHETPAGSGQFMYDLWSTNGMCPPELMQGATWFNPFLLVGVGYTNNTFRVDFHCRPGTSYTIEYTDSLSGTVTWHSFEANGTHVAGGDTSFFEDDFTASTSGSPSATGTRFYRFSYSPAL